MGKHKVTIHATFSTVITNDDPVEAQAICSKLFEDDISSKSEMFSVRAGRVIASPYREKQKPKCTLAEIQKAMRKRYRFAWGLWLQGFTLQQVGGYLSVTRSRAEQILKRCNRMRRHRFCHAVEGDNWKASPRLDLTLSEYRARIL